MSDHNSRTRVLHVDDNPEFVELAAEFLEREGDGIAVETGTSADDGIDRIADGEIDCVVSDYEMPGRNGIEFLERVREHDPDLPFILFTGRGSEEVASDAISAGVTDYLQKGTGDGQYVVLANRIDNAVEGTRAASELETSRERLKAAERSRREIHRITAADLGLEEKMRRLLEAGFEALGMENGHVVEIDRGADEHRVRFAAGSDLVEAGIESPLSGTFCAETVGTDAVVTFATAADGNDPRHERWGIGCYAGAELVVDGDRFGTVCFVDSEPREEPLAEEHRATLELVARSVSQVLERNARRRERAAITERMTDALLAVDRDWNLEYANGQGWAFLREERAEGAPDAEEGTPLWAALPDAVGTEFHGTCLTAMDEQRPVSFDGYYPPGDRWLDARVYPDETGVSVYVEDVTDRRCRAEAIRDRQRIIREMYDAVSDDDRVFEGKVGALIEIGQRIIGTEYGSLSNIDGEEYTFEVVGGPDGGAEAGDVVDIGVTNCERTAHTERTVVLSDIAKEAPELTERDGYAEWGVACYVGTPVVVDESVYGTFCFYDTEPREEPFSEWEVAVVDLMGKLIGYELQRQRAEERLRRQNERLEGFASVVSHDLRSPLSVASGNVELAREECDSDRLAAADDALDRMETLIDSLLTLAKEGESAAGTEPVDIGEAARRHWGTVETAAATLVVETDRTVEAEPSQLAQLFENLVRNAVEHGTADDDAPTVTVGDLPDGFFVADDGPGIPDDERDRIFEVGHSGVEGGTGFGLAIVARVAEAHGWTVEATESESGGARFEITGIEPAE